MNSDFKADFYRMTGTEYKLTRFYKLAFMHNLRYMFWWRLRNKGNPLAKIICFKMGKKYGLEIGNCKIGKGLYLGHAYNITVNSEAVIGNNVNLHKGVTIGRENRGGRQGAPIIGNSVYVGINSTIVGNIHIGDDVLIGANSFVNFDVPDHSVVIGNPATIHHKEGATKGYCAFIVK